MAATACWGLYERTDQWAYRIILIIQFLIPIVMIVGGFILPESPRWLVRQGRAEEARKVLLLLRKDQQPADVDAEIAHLAAAEEQQKMFSAESTWLDCFKGPNLRRTAIAAGVQCLQNAQGNSFMANYSILFLQAIGMTDVYRILVLLYFTNMAASGFAFYFADKIGRRPLMFVAASVMAICMCTVAGIVTRTPTTAGQNGALACLFIWQFVQAIGWSSCVWIVTAEVPSTHLRERTVTIATVSGFIVGVLVTYINPFMQNPGYGDLGGKVGFVYGSFSVVAAVWVALFLPEMKGRSLEELDELFAKKVPTFRFGAYKLEGGEVVTEKVDEEQEVTITSKA
ncbi:hypothetical protein BAUCODRAFT_35650 [Baudoinia panamericana UAMH 10762]|uniref:Major facilitator superfamily (MFS) profile domain-containing protein n=1 Tax=Baudoinia panamericana (strain UAMH 10762) TaxID=717646 RepID=M2MSE1_BAUPA|nr:uncharacterized protein BAUCODRAFT_35650 [Baudoinia panamericana UAMH 10762]EMC94423.1 hypothetical protein BAUCODRAFT_35650 [Baudoinia panamericana UAMH 10762]